MSESSRRYKTRALVILAILLLPAFILFVATKANTEGASSSDLAIVAALGLTCVGSIAYGLVMATVSLELGAEALHYRRAGREWKIPYTSIRGWEYKHEHKLLEIENPVKKVHVYLIKDVHGLMRELERRVGYVGRMS